MGAVAAVPCPAVPRLAAVRKLVQARQAFQALEAWRMREESCQLPLHDVEREQERRGREIQRLLVEAHGAQRGTGDVGPAIVVQELRRRDPARRKRWVGLTDGERALQASVKRRRRGVPLVLEFQHAVAKLWTAVYACHEEGSPKALTWVQERAWRLLHGEVSQVVQGMRLNASKRALGGQQRQVVEAVAASFDRNRRHMRYDEDLRHGWPIATGVVEGACKNLVKDRSATENHAG